MQAVLTEVRPALAALAAIGGVTFAYLRWLTAANATTVALSFLLVVLVAAATARLRVAVLASVGAMLSFNYFFLPPIGRWTIADPQNWVALVVFLAVSLVASRLSHETRARTIEALARRDELARLFDLSRDVMVMAATPDSVGHLARAIGRRFDLDYVAIALPTSHAWSVAAAGVATPELDPQALTDVYDAARHALEFDARARTYAGHRTITVDDQVIRLVPLRVGTTPIGILAASGRPIEPGTIDTLAGVVAIAIERTRFLDERKTAELTKQSEELKSALLASLGHDLRTPLTAIRVAAANLKASWPTERERVEQADLILEEVDRLTRLFANVLEMAKIDAGAVTPAPRWTHPSEIVAAARDQVAQSLASHPVTVEVGRDDAVQIDARLTASALAQLLDNAAQYAPAESPIEVRATADSSKLQVQVRDHGPGIPAADLPHLFERFYRGAAASRRRSSGSGMGLWIARELLGAARGRVWAENCTDGGARFTIVVPHSGLPAVGTTAS